MKRRLLILGIIAFFPLCFLLYETPPANSTIQKDFRIPSQFGVVKEAFEPSSTTPNSDLTIIHIQDAHCNYEAQKNLAKLLEYLIKEDKLNLIMVEGGTGNVSLSFLRGYADKATRESIADKYLKMGKISGEEYLDLVCDNRFELYGIEDESLYNAHLASFREMNPIREEGLGYLNKVSYIVTNLKPYIYSQELSQLEEKRADYEGKKITLAEYCDYLVQLADKKGLGLKGYSNVAAFSNTSKFEKEVDFKLAETERSAFIKELAKIINEEELDNLLKKSQEFSEGKLTAQEYYSFLKTQAEGKIDLGQDYLHLVSYINYISSSKQINTEGLLQELGSLENSLKESCLINDEQRKLNNISKSLAILSGLFNLELSPQEYKYFQENIADFTTSGWIDFLSESCRRHNLAFVPATSGIIDHNLDKLDKFYRLGIDREKVFIKNIVDKMNKSGEKLAVLITGGFHTPGISRALKDKGYSYIEIVPVTSSKGDSGLYFSVLKGKNQLFENLGE
ncbi:MAG: hypothetical protein V1674_03250 [Candidatus Omnitrophota bacterium]